MRHLASHGYRFTLNAADTGGHLSSANRYWTNLPSPYFDRDMDGFFKCTEAEITSESASFPSATSTYFGSFYFTHWYYVSAQGGWQWDPNSGYVELSEQVSEQYPFADDKWDTTLDFNPHIAYIGLPWYPSKLQPSVKPSASADPCQFDGGPMLAGAPVPLEAASRSAEPDLKVTLGDEVGEIVVERPASVSLEDHRKGLMTLGAALAQIGPARGVTTFGRPLSAADIDALMALGLEIDSAEAVSDVLADGTRASFGGDYDASFWDSMEDLAAEHGVSMLGVTSATVRIADMQTYRALVRHPDVYLVDLSGDQLRRSNPDVTDVAVDDVYWELAGWSDQ
jgi:hypothetical protein